MIPIYVISLRDADERRNYIASELGRLAAPFQFFDAFDGRTMTRAELEAAAPKRGVHYCGMLTPEEVGCALSHLTVIRQIAEGDSEFAAVLEDDVSVASEGRGFLDEQYLRSLPPFDILQLDGAHPEGSLRLTIPVGEAAGHRLYALTKCQHSVYSLIYTREAARRVTAALPKVTAPIDNMIFKDARVLGLRIVALRPSVAKHIGMPSVIGDRPRLKGLPNKIEREGRRLWTWCRRWYSFVQAWGLLNTLRLRPRKSG